MAITRRRAETHEKVDERFAWRPFGRRVAYRRAIQIEQADQDLADDSSANRTQPVAVGADGRLPKNVKPQRRLAAPPGRSRADLVSRERRYAEVPGNRLTGRQRHPLPALEVAYCERMKLLDLAVAGDHHRQLDQCADQPAVDLPRTVGGRPSRQIEHTRPVHALVGRDGPEADEIRENRDGDSLIVQLIFLTNLPVSVPIRGICELERDIGVACRPVVPAVACDEETGQILTDEPWQKLPKYYRLVVPPQLAGGGLEDRIGRHAVIAHAVHERIVRMHEREMHLRHEHMRVVARIADDGRPFDIPQ